MELPAQHPLTLRFQSDALEDAFRAEYVRRSLRQVRYALLLGVAIYGLVFGVVDYLSVPAQAPTNWLIRGVVCAGALAVFAFSYTARFERHMQPALSLLLAGAGGGLVLMLALDPSGENYFEGPVLLLLPLYVVVRLRFVWASLAGWSIVAAYVAVAAGLKNLPPGELAGSIIFIASANVIGQFAGYMLEDYARRQFWQARVIDEKRAENAELLDARSRFFANVSHELRTPLTLILGPLDDLLDEDAESPVPRALRRPLRRVQRNARRLRRLINQLLDLAKLEAGGLALHARQAPLAPFLRGVTRSFDGLARREEIDLQFEAASDDLAVYFDPDKLETVLVNLLSNALKFTPAGGTVRVSVGESPDEEDGTAQIRVRDTGPGIAPEEQAHLFDRFHQASDSVLRQQEGTGIGLAFARELTELHGGQIGVESEPGFGATFTVTLPLGRGHLRDEQIVEGAEDGEKKRGEERRRRREEARAGEREGPEAGEAAGEETTVLVVEDNADVRAYVRDALAGGAGTAYEVREAADGEEGLEVARAVVPDLIVTDVMMPGMDGYAFCRALKDDPVLDHIPVIMLTAKAESEHRVEGLEAGADAYLGKPFSRRELKARVANLLENRRRLRKRFSQDVLVRPRPVEVPSADERFIRRAKEAVEEHIGDAGFDVDAFAEAVGMSRRQLQRKLRAVADQTPSAFVRLIRLGRGAQLLAQDYGTVAEVAYAVGFNSPSYFTKRFRETFGTTPSEYEPDGNEAPVPQPSA